VPLPRKAALALLLVLSAPAGAAPPAATAEQIATWVRQLGADDFATREKATKLLWEAGKAADPAVQAAARSEDPEVRRRATEVLDKFRWGIYPDTPAEVVALIGRYQAGAGDVKETVVRQLLDRGGPGCAALAKIVTAEPNPDIQRVIALQMSLDAARAYPALLAAEDLGTLEELLELSLAVEHDDQAFQNYAAFWLLRGKLDERITRFVARAAAREGAPTALEALTFLYRAKGDLPAARRVAAHAGRQDLLEMVLVDQQDWSALAKLADERADQAGGEDLGLRAAYHRLAGDTAGMEKALADIRTAATGAGDNDGRWLHAKDLLLNGRPQDAADLLDTPNHAARAFEILSARMQFRDALALADRFKDQPQLVVLKARTQYLLGEKNQAMPVFGRFADEIKEGKANTWHEELVRAEYRLGLREEALELCARLLANTKADGNQAKLLGLVFPRSAEQAHIWWQFLRHRFPTEDPPAVMKRLRDLLGGKTAAKDFQALLDDAEEFALKHEPDEREQWLLVLAETSLAAKLDAAAQKYLEQAAAVPGPRPQALLRLGDFLADKKLWEQAAERYGQSWERDRRQPLPLFLKGWALSQGGSGAAGRKLMELAHWIPLGDDALRQEFADALMQRGQKDAAGWERDLLFRTCRPASYYAGEALHALALDALVHKDYLKAADCQDRALLRCFNPNTDFVEEQAYLSVPQYIHRLRARGLAATGKLDEARKEVRVCLAILPGNIDLPLQLVPALEKAGRNKEADELFDQALEVHQKVCADFSRSAWAHNNAAWLSAGCRRNLDNALEHARKAVDQAPEQVGFLDTLAEVHFQRGDQAKAIELMKQCIALEPKTAYFGKQLKRFETGDRAREVPSATDDD
jgi:tetratricopeptide (TPR) repeat protein